MNVLARRLTHDRCVLYRLAHSAAERLRESIRLMTRHRIVVASGLVMLLGSCASSSSGADAGSTCDPETDAPCGAGEICSLSSECVAPKYTPNTDGTVTDNVTGLVWQQPVAMSPCPADGNGCTFAGAQTYCQMLSLGGESSGWRLPTLSELFSLVEFGSSLPNIDPTAFPNAPTAVFWTSSPYETGGAWVVDFGGGYPFGSPTNPDGGAVPVESVRCVR